MLSIISTPQCYMSTTTCYSAHFKQTVKPLTTM